MKKFEFVRCPSCPENDPPKYNDHGLYPCPFCGSDQVIFGKAFKALLGEREESDFVFCLRCQNRTQGYWTLENGKKRAEYAWNRRPS